MSSGDLEAKLTGSVAHVPAELLPQTSGDGVALYALLRCMGPACDTYRSKDSLAEFLGWNRKRLFRAASDLEAAGWLVRSTHHAKGGRRSTWKVRKSRDKSGTRSRDRSGTRPRPASPIRPLSRDKSGTTRIGTNRGQENPTLENPPSGWAGTQLAELDSCFASLTSWQAQRVPQGHERVREALASVLARPTAPRGVTGEQLVMAWLERLTGTRGVGGMRDAEAVLIAEARKRDAAADALAYAEAVAEGRKRPPADQTRAPPEPQGETEQVDLSALERISSRQASPTTTRSRGA